MELAYAAGDAGGRRDFRTNLVSDAMRAVDSHPAEEAFSLYKQLSSVTA